MKISYINALIYCSNKDVVENCRLPEGYDDKWMEERVGIKTRYCCRKLPGKKFGYVVDFIFFFLYYYLSLKLESTSYIHNLGSDLNCSYEISSWGARRR